MLNSTQNRLVPGVAGVVEDGILPGFFGYETGQAAVGDAFHWLRQLLGHKTFSRLTADAAALAPGAGGVRCMDWMNGCRTPLMDGDLKGAFTGLTLNHRPGHLFRATLEGSACGLRWIVHQLQEHGVAVKSFIATGGLPHHNPLFVQICADVLGKEIKVHPSAYGSALGAAILGALAAGRKATGFSSIGDAIRKMANPKSLRPAIIQPRQRSTKAYHAVYGEYRALAEALVQLKNKPSLRPKFPLSK